MSSYYKLAWISALTVILCTVAICTLNERYQSGQINGPAHILSTIVPRVRLDSDWLRRAPVPRHIVTSYSDVRLVPATKLRQWISQSPGWSISVYGDDHAEVYIRRRCGDDMADWFRGIRDGPIRGDIFRVVYLYYEGGVWLDVDLELRAPLDSVAGTREGTVTTVRCCTRRPYRSQPIMIAARSRHPFMGACLRIYREMCARDTSYRYWTFSIVTVFEEVSRAVGGHLPMWAGDEHCAWCETGLFRKRDLRSCHVTDLKGRLLMRDRSDDYDPYSHKFIGQSPINGESSSRQTAPKPHRM